MLNQNQESNIEYYKLGNKVNEYIKCKCCSKEYSIGEKTINVYSKFHPWMRNFCSMICYLKYNEEHKIVLSEEGRLKRFFKRLLC